VAFLALVTVEVAVAGAAQFWFAPAGCEFKVAFPSEPKVTTQFVEGVGTMSTAAGGVRGAVKSTLVLVAEGMPMDPSALGGMDPAAFLLERARQYAAFNGLTHAEYQAEVTSLGNIVSFRGGKNVGGVDVLYMGKIVLGRRSMLMLRGGGAASSFPQKGLLEFMDSIRQQS
jgi:hypothetical protein